MLRTVLGSAVACDGSIGLDEPFEAFLCRCANGHLLLCHQWYLSAYALFCLLDIFF